MHMLHARKVSSLWFQLINENNETFHAYGTHYYLHVHASAYGLKCGQDMIAVSQEFQ